MFFLSVVMVITFGPSVQKRKQLVRFSQILSAKGGKTANVWASDSACVVASLQKNT